MGWEIIKEPQFGPGGSFTPMADQTKFISTFGVTDGPARPGFMSSATLESVGIPTRDGKGRLVFKPFMDENKKANTVNFEGMKLRELIAPREDAQAKEKYEANLSNEWCSNYYSPKPEQVASDTQVGRKVLEANTYNERVLVPHDS